MTLKIENTGVLRRYGVNAKRIYVRGVVLCDTCSNCGAQGAAVLRLLAEVFE